MPFDDEATSDRDWFLPPMFVAAMSRIFPHSLRLSVKTIPASLGVLSGADFWSRLIPRFLPPGMRSALGRDALLRFDGPPAARRGDCASLRLDE